MKVGWAGKGKVAKAMVQFERESAAYAAETKPTAQALAVARHLADRLDALGAAMSPRLSAVIGGGMQFGYHSDGEPRREFEIDVLPDGSAYYLLAFGPERETEMAMGLMAPGEFGEVLPTMVEWVAGEDGGVEAR